MKDENKVKVFVSQPMSDIPTDDVSRTRAEAEKIIDKYFVNYHTEYKIVSTYTDPEAVEANSKRHPKIYRLGHALMVLADCDYIYFAGEWKNKRSCVIEFIAARMFDVNIIPSDNTKNKVNIQITNSQVKEYEY